jgi:hypothetical protein
MNSRWPTAGTMKLIRLSENLVALNMELTTEDKLAGRPDDSKSPSPNLVSE